MIVSNEPRPHNAILLQIDLTVDSVNEFAKDKLEFYVEWVQFRKTVLAMRFKQKSVVDRLWLCKNHSSRKSKQCLLLRISIADHIFSTC